MTKREPLFATEADLVAAFCAQVDINNANRNRSKNRWTVYHETAGWDLLLVGETGSQIGVEAKLALNAKVLEQALPKYHGSARGPDFRAVLVPEGGLQLHLTTIAAHLGITIIRVGMLWNSSSAERNIHPRLPDESSNYDRFDWHPWWPAEREIVPDYVPDVTGGKAAPLMLTPWKVKAIQLVLVLDRLGAITRRDIEALGVSPSRWTSRGDGFLTPDGAGGYVRCGRTPNFRAQHPTNYVEIEADIARWCPAHLKAALVEQVPA